MGAHESHLTERVHVPGQLRALSAQRLRQVVDARFTAGQFLEQREVDGRSPQLALEDQARVVEQRCLAIQHALAHALPERPATADLRQVARHAAGQRVAGDDVCRLFPLEQLPRFTEGQRSHVERLQSAVQRAPLGQQTLHLTDDRAAEDELRLGVVALLFHHGSDGTEQPLPRGSLRKQQRELVDNGDDLLPATKAVEDPHQVRRVAYRRTHAAEVVGDLVRETSQLRCHGTFVRNQDDRGLAIREATEEPRLSDAPTTVDAQCVARPVGPPLLKPSKVSRPVYEVIAYTEIERVHNWFSTILSQNQLSLDELHTSADRRRPTRSCGAAFAILALDRHHLKLLLELDADASVEVGLHSLPAPRRYGHVCVVAAHQVCGQRKEPAGP